MWRSPRRFCRHDVLIRFLSGNHFSKKQPGDAATSRRCVIMPRHAPVTIGRLNRR